MLTIFNNNEFNIFDFVLGISESIDLISPEMNNHHKQVAYIAYKIAVEMKLDHNSICDIIFAATLHDIGAFSANERLSILKDVDSKFPDKNRHAYVGYMLLNGFQPLEKAAEIIRYHHSEAFESIPVESCILNLSDTVVILIDEKNEILEQTNSIIQKIKNMSFPNEIRKAFLALAEREYFWVEVCSLASGGIVSLRSQMSRNIIGLELLLDFSKTMAQIIDFRSRFTATHTSGVAAVALELTNLFEFSEKECILMEIAGYLHDLGKLAVSNEILEKPGALDMGELNVMKKHTYFTYLVLSRIKGIEDVAMWAAYHHERPSGKGYPFHVKGKDFTKLSRIMAVADIFTAITEDRPYRKGMDADTAIKVLRNMADNDSADAGVVKVVEINFDKLNKVRKDAQEEALNRYNDFIMRIEEFDKTLSLYKTDGC